MKRFLLVLLVIAFLGCDQPRTQGQPMDGQETVTTATPGAAGLDLQALGEIVRQSRTASEIEQKVNTPGGINNLDLDQDNNVDYIHVTEYANGGTRGFSFTVNNRGEKQELATIQVTNTGQQANVVIAGNQTLYGNNAYYSANYTLTDFLIWQYMWRPHVYYVSPYHYGYYPTYYHPYHSRPYTEYHSHVTNVTRTTVIKQTTVNNYKSASPNSRYSSSSYARKASPAVTSRSYTPRQSSSSSRSYSPSSSGSSSRSYSSPSRRSSPSRSYSSPSRSYSSPSRSYSRSGRR
jgi:hypothetical protein